MADLPAPITTGGELAGSDLQPRITKIQLGLVEATEAAYQAMIETADKKSGTINEQGARSHFLACAEKMLKALGHWQERQDSPTPPSVNILAAGNVQVVEQRIITYIRELSDEQLQRVIDQSRASLAEPDPQNGASRTIQP